MAGNGMRSWLDRQADTGFPIVAFLLGYAGDAAKVLLRPRSRLGRHAGRAPVILAFGIPWQMQFNPDLDPVNLLEASRGQWP